MDILQRAHFLDLPEYIAFINSVSEYKVAYEF